MTELALDRKYYHLHTEMIEWARKNIGTGGWRRPNTERGDTWGLIIAFGHQQWYFINEKDAMIFTLKWIND